MPGGRPIGRPPNPGPVRINGLHGRRLLEKHAALTKMPRAPKGFNKRMVYDWYYFGKKLITDGVLTPIAVPAFERWCRAYEDYRKANTLVEQVGVILLNKQTGNAYLNPAYSAKLAASREMAAIEIEFGMTPAAATRINVVINNLNMTNPADSNTVRSLRQILLEGPTRHNGTSEQ